MKRAGCLPGVSGEPRDIGRSSIRVRRGTCFVGCSKRSGCIVALYDQHVHTRYSWDSEADPAANLRQAIGVGLAGLTFTDHFDSHPSEWPQCRYDYERIAAAVVHLRERFGGPVFIGHGIEICYQPDRMDMILDYLRPRRFDVVLLSVHWFGGRALHVRQHWEGLDAASGTRAYLEAVLEAAQFVRELNNRGRRPFDVLGHLDLVKRYTQRYFETFDLRPHGELVEEILRTCIEGELVPEVNLSTLRQSLPEPSPGDWVVRRYAELGGEAMSLGSDAHRPEDVGAGLHEWGEVLKRQGIRNLAVFKDRQRCDEPI